MKIPVGKTEAEVLAAIEKSVALLAPSFVFGYYDVDDLKQQGRLYALEVLEKERYDPARPLENFLYVHIRNRYVNLKRDKLRRTDAPCVPCHQGDFCTNSAEPCHKYSTWKNRNSSKANLMRPLDLNFVADKVHTEDSSVVSSVEQEEILQLIDTKLPVELRSAYVQMREGVSVPKAKRTQVENAVRDILRDEQWHS